VSDSLFKYSKNVNRVTVVNISAESSLVRLSLVCGDRLSLSRSVVNIIGKDFKILHTTCVR